MKKGLLFASFISLFSNFYNAQNFYSENFETGNASQWTFIDRDNDGKFFSVKDASSINAEVFGHSTLISYSYQNTALHPDNLAISPVISLPADIDNLYLKYDVWSYDGQYGAEHYAIYVTESNDPDQIVASTPVFEETLPGSGGLKLDKMVDITSFKGKDVYVTFRHYNCTDQYWMMLDNIEVKQLLANDAKIAKLKLNKYTEPNASNTLEVTIKNAGKTPITSAEINWNDGTDHIANIDVNIPVGGSKVVTHPATISYSDVAQKDINVTITKVNGDTDPIESNNTGATSIVVLSQVIPKKVFFEEGTGTWCGWCPRGMVALEKVNTEYPNDQVSIAVHNQDPMMVTEYDGGASFSGFPGMNVDRELLGVDISPNTIGNYVNSRKTIPTPVQLGGNYTIDGSTLTVNASAQLFSNFTHANYRLAAIVVEDGVQGTGPGYKQANYYAGGGNGTMGGFEHLPSSVPAAEMVYDHVGRALLGGYDGQENSVPETIADQQTVNYTFTYTIPDKYNSTTTPANDVVPNPDNMHVVLLLIDQNDGTVANAVKLEKGGLAVNDASLAKTTVLYPNPASTDFNIKFAKDGKYNVVIYDMSGKTVTNYGSVSTSGKIANLPIRLLPGKYIVNISQNGVSYSKDLLVK